MRTNLRSRLGSKASSAPFWVDYELNWNLQEALRQWNALTGYWAKATAVPVASGARFVTLPSSITSPGRATWSGTPLQLTSLYGLDYGNPEWQSITAATPRYWSPIGLNLIALYPAPNVTTTVSLSINGIVQTPILASDGVTVDLEQAFFDPLLDYAKHLCLFKLGGPEFAESTKAKEGLFTAAGEFNRRLKASSLYRDVLGIIQQNQQHPMVAGSRSVSPKK
jgi:hypothetical protein